MVTEEVRRAVRVKSAFARKAREVGENRGNQCLSSRIMRRERRRKEVEEVTGLFSRFLPICRGRGQQVGFQFGLPKAQFFFVRLDIRQEPAQLGRFLRGHAAMLVEVDRLIGHDRALRRVSGYFSLSYSRRISSLPYLCSST